MTATIGGVRAGVLRDVSFHLQQGQVLGLVGESGAGKSMIGRVLARDLPPGFTASAGRLAFAGHDLLGMNASAFRALLGREIAFIPQEPLSALNPVLTVGRQFDEHLRRVAPGPARERRDRAVAALASVLLRHPEDLLARYPHQLSGGMCQRVLIAMAFASDPKLVVADEPTTALDVTVQAELVRLIRDMQARHGTAILFITHDLRLAAHIADEVLVLYAGRPAERGPASLFARPAHPYTRCLQLAAPAVRGERRRLYALPERMPGLLASEGLPGCRFAPRCPNAAHACEAGEPALVQVGRSILEPSPLGEGRARVSAARPHPDLGALRAPSPGGEAEHVAACLYPELTPTIRPPPPDPVRAAEDGTDLLELRAVAKTFTSRRLFGGAKRFTAVRPASFRVGQGEFVGLVGESGSGKSTLARMIVGLERPSAGQIIRRFSVQMVFQDPQSALNPRRRVGSIVTQALEVTAATAAVRRATAERLLAEVGLPPETASRYPAQLSGGQKQRVNIARALAAEPALLVADEIVSGLDVSVQAQVIGLLLRLQRERGFAMLFISHDLSVVRHLCSRVLVMRTGEIVETGSTAAVFADPAHPYTRALLDAVPPDVLDVTVSR